MPPFAALEQVQDKLSALRTLARLEVPQPRTVVVHDPSEAENWDSFPAYVKAPVGTGSTGVRRVTDAAALADAVRAFIAAGALLDGGVLVQEALTGTFVMAQCVFDAGSLVAFHANERVQEGANGSAAAKASIEASGLRAELARLGEALEWHGALSVDAIVVDRRAYVIDVNPRLVEPGNALAAGTDMVSALLAVAMGTPPRAVSPVPARRAHPPIPHGAPGYRPAHADGAAACWPRWRGVSDGAASTPTPPRSCSPGAGTDGRRSSRWPPPWPLLSGLRCGGSSPMAPSPATP